jgi:hypothetical protein
MMVFIDFIVNDFRKKVNGAGMNARFSGMKKTRCAGSEQNGTAVQQNQLLTSAISRA